MRRWLPVVAFAILAACQEPPSDPAGTYRAFHFAIAEGDWNRAVGLLAPETRRVFEEVGRGLAEAVGYSDDPLTFFLRGVRATVRTPLHEVEVIEQQASRATVRVKAGKCDRQDERRQPDCSVTEVVLERVDGRWLIVADLPDVLRESIGSLTGG